MKKLKTKLKPAQKISPSGSNAVYKILKVWPGYEAGRTDRPVIWGTIHRLSAKGIPLKSERPINKILEYHYGGPPMLAGSIVK
jgi:hypothetical protein